MNRAIVVTALALVAVTATASAASAGEEGTRTKVRVVQLRHDGEATAATLADIQGDRVKIEDLDTLLPGETRSYYTESGREVLVTRGEGDRYTVEVEGRKVEIGGSVDELLAAHAGTAGGKRRVVIHRAEEKGEGTSEVTEDHTEVIAGGDLAGALTLPEGAEPPVVVEIVGGGPGRVERRVLVLAAGEPDGEN